MATAKDPRLNRPYTELIYQPMLEVMQLLRANGYKTYFVTGGGQDFVRVYSERTYGIPANQVVGSAAETKFGYGPRQGDPHQGTEAADERQEQASPRASTW